MAGGGKRRQAAAGRGQRELVWARGMHLKRAWVILVMFNYALRGHLYEMNCTRVLGRSLDHHLDGHEQLQLADPNL